MNKIVYEVTKMIKPKDADKTIDLYVLKYRTYYHNVQNVFVNGDVDIGQYVTKQHDSRPRYFSLQEKAETSKNDLIDKLEESGYVLYKLGKLRSVLGGDSTREISVSLQKVEKKDIMHEGSKTYFFDKSNNNKYDIVD